MYFDILNRLGLDHDFDTDRRTQHREQPLAIACSDRC